MMIKKVAGGDKVLSEKRKKSRRPVQNKKRSENPAEASRIFQVQEGLAQSA
jgi:hypothetical protein